MWCEMCRFIETRKPYEKITCFIDSKSFRGRRGGISLTSSRRRPRHHSLSHEDKGQELRTESHLCNRRASLDDLGSANPVSRCFLHFSRSGKLTSPDPRTS